MKAKRTVSASREKRRRDVAANMRALRQRKAIATASGAPTGAVEVTEPVEAPSAVTADDAVTGYLRAVVAWARVERTPEAGRFAGMAGDLIEQSRTMRPGERSPAQIEKLREMFGDHLKLIKFNKGDDLQRSIASENLALAAETLTAGRADGKSIRTGLRSCAVLIRRRPRIDESAIGLAWASMNASFGPPPTAETECGCTGDDVANNDPPRRHKVGDHYGGTWQPNDVEDVNDIDLLAIEAELSAEGEPDDDRID